MVATWELRAAFAASLSQMYGREVPAYNTLVEVSTEVNRDVLERAGSDAERLGSIDRVTAERHGAIRVGTGAEMRQVATIFAALGMQPVGFYDLRDASASSVPVVSTAFRPVAADELARNPFRVFTSVLVSDDRRYFSAEVQQRLEEFLSGRTLFGDELLALAERAEAEGGLPGAAAERFLELATAAFELSPEPVDRAWYQTLEAISSVAADIGGVASTHINHLTPRVLDIDELYRRMEERGITMIDAIQGPPRWAGPDVLLRQTSFRALAEPRTFRNPDGSISQDALRVRFGEVEARGIALTPAGRDVYDRTVAEVDAASAAAGGAVDATGGVEEARRIWAANFPDTERGMAAADLAFFSYRVADRPADGTAPPADLAALVDGGWLVPEPIVYEDFLPRSAAGIFQSNLTSEGSKDAAEQGSVRDARWLGEVLGRPVTDPADLYAAQRQASLDEAATALGLPEIRRGAPTAGA
ncbi:MAG: 2-oxoadipate dioxygenase/decarboxylase [Propionibacteriaceae bacterium]